jgi:hypothetical protein
MLAGGPMTKERALRVCFISLWLWLLLTVGAAGQDTPNTRKSVPKAGSTVLTAISPKGKASVTIGTAAIEGECLKASAAAGFLTESGAQDASVVPHLSISIAGKPIAVPPAVYSGLFNPMWASLSYKEGIFDLSINEGVDLYLVHIYFTASDGVTRMTVYDYVGAKIVEEARFHQVVLK